MQLVAYTGGTNVPTVESVTRIVFVLFDANGNGAGGYKNLIVHETRVGGIEGTEVFTGLRGLLQRIV